MNKIIFKTNFCRNATVRKDDSDRIAAVLFT